MNKLSDITNRFRPFEVSCVPATNTRPTRVKIKDLRHEKSIILSYTAHDQNMEDLALDYLNKKGIKISALAMGKNEFSLLSEDFATQMV
jgi:hypothetical protein